MPPSTTRPVGLPTRGTTNPNRLRRCDRWLTGPGAHAFSHRSAPVLVDLGFGATPVTTFELATRAATVVPNSQVVGIEIDAERVEEARRQLPFLDPSTAQRVSFRRGGFEVPLDGIRGGERGAHVIRAFNVLRQYDEAQVRDAWALLAARLAPGGILIDGTCDELGRLASWIVHDDRGPRSWTMSVHLATLGRPGRVAERLPKALIHRNVPGEWIHDLLTELDRHWDASAPYAGYGLRHRWIATCSAYAAHHPVIGRADRWRLGELTVPWPA